MHARAPTPFFGAASPMMFNILLSRRPAPYVGVEYRRLIDRLCSQIAHVMEINEVKTIIKELLLGKISSLDRFDRLTQRPWTK